MILFDKIYNLDESVSINSLSITHFGPELLVVIVRNEQLTASTVSFVENPLDFEGSVREDLLSLLLRHGLHSFQTHGN